MIPPQGSKTKQGYELQLGTNCVAPFLFTKLLTPILLQTAKTAPKDSVRIVWVSSNGAEYFSPKNGVDMNNLDYKKDQAAWHKYGVSKAGNILHGQEFARRYGAEGIISVVSGHRRRPSFQYVAGVTRLMHTVQSLNPGGLKTELQRHLRSWQSKILVRRAAFQGFHSPTFWLTSLIAGFYAV